MTPRWWRSSSAPVMATGSVLESVLGDLEPQHAGIGAGRVQRALVRLATSVGVGELAGGQVDGDRHPGPRLAPAAHLVQRLLDHPVADGHDQPGLLGQRHELRRTDEPPLGVLPADERLEADEPGIAVDRHPRLVVDAQLLRARGRSAATTPSPTPRLSGGGRCRRSARSPRAAQLLGAVHGRVGVADGVVDRGRRIGDHRDPDAHPHRALLAAEADGKAGGVADALGDDHRLALALHAFEEEGELVAAEPGDGVHRPQEPDETVGEHGEQPVTGAVPERVVDLLEGVDVEEQQRDGGARPPRAIQGDGQPVEEERPVGQPGERVMERLAGQLHLRALALDRIADGPGQRRRRQLGDQQVILGAAAHGVDAELVVVILREHDDRRARSSRAQRLEHLRGCGRSRGRSSRTQVAPCSVSSCAASGTC